MSRVVRKISSITSDHFINRTRCGRSQVAHMVSIIYRPISVSRTVIRCPVSITIYFTCFYNRYLYLIYDFPKRYSDRHRRYLFNIMYICMRLPIFYYNTYNTYVCVWILMSMIARVDFVEKTLKVLVYTHYTDNNYIISI